VVEANEEVEKTEETGFDILPVSLVK